MVLSCKAERLEEGAADRQVSSDSAPALAFTARRGDAWPIGERMMMVFPMGLTISPSAGRSPMSLRAGRPSAPIVVVPPKLAFFKTTFIVAASTTDDSVRSARTSERVAWGPIDRTIICMREAGIATSLATGAARRRSAWMRSVASAGVESAVAQAITTARMNVRLSLAILPPSFNVHARGAPKPMPHRYPDKMKLLHTLYIVKSRKGGGDKKKPDYRTIWWCSRAFQLSCLEGLCFIERDLVQIARRKCVHQKCVLQNETIIRIGVFVEHLLSKTFLRHIPQILA
jgi:hypothetical protein